MTLPIRYKLAGLVIIAVLMTVLFQLIYSTQKQIEDLGGALHRKANSLTVLVAHELSAALEFDDRTAMTEMLTSLSRDEDVVFAAVFDKENERIAAVGSGGNERDTLVQTVSHVLVDKSDEEGLLRLFAPISSRMGAGGTLLVVFSTDSIIEGTRLIWLGSGTVALLILAFATAFSLVVGHRIGRRMERIAEETQRIAEGDLSRAALNDQQEDEIGRVARAFDQMVEHQREMVGQITQTAMQLNTSAQQFLATAHQQERGATEQSSSVEETHRTIETLVDSSREIAGTAQGVLKNAERAQETAATMSDRIAQLSQQTQRISEILELIKSIASKSELLALNAALEGTKAGEAGRGFSLVATQMQRLAENVMEAVRDIRDMTDSIREATQSTVLAMEETTKLSSDTTRSARQITLIIQQQQSGTEQVSMAIEEVAQIAVDTVSASKQIVGSSTDILGLCERLQRLVSGFTLEASASSSGEQNGKSG